MLDTKDRHATPQLRSSAASRSGRTVYSGLYCTVQRWEHSETDANAPNRRTRRARLEDDV